jgi:tRNA A-37 threonylcarbamoyl transferase component Bud32/tetratricopeptide (TPR) repeat protein
MEKPLPTNQFANYTILDRVAGGSSGEVFRAEESTSGRIVALKRYSISHSAADQSRIEWRFQREVEAAASLEHGNIATVFTHGFTDGAPWLAMEFIDGKPIDVFADERKLLLHERLALVLAVCDGVQHAHNRGVLHRDLKPANIFVREMDGVPKVLDFGLARFLGDEEIGVTLSLHGQPLGTPMFMAPEQISGNHRGLDVTADVYSLGVILYRLADGGWPYDHSLGPVQMLATARDSEPRPPKVGRDLSSIIQKAMAREKIARYQSVAEFAADLRRFLDGDAVHARRGAAMYRTRKWLRKNYIPLAAAASIFLTGSVLAYRWELERKRAEAQRQRAFTQAKEILNAALADLHGKLDSIGHSEWIGEAAERIATLPWDGGTDGQVDIHRYKALAAEIRGETLASKGKPAQALESYRAALSHLALLPKSPALSGDIARLSVLRGHAWLQLNQVEDALESANRARVALDAIPKPLPADTESRISHHAIRAECLRRNKKPEQSEPELLAAVALARTVTTPDITAATIRLSDLLNDLGTTCATLAKNDSAERAFTEAENLMRAVVAKTPASLFASAQLSRALQGRALLRKNSHLHDAVRLLDEARTLHEIHRPFHRERLIGADTDLARTGLQLARASFEAGADPSAEFDKCLGDARFALDINRGNTKAHGVLAEIRQTRARYYETTGQQELEVEDLLATTSHLKSVIRVSQTSDSLLKLAAAYARLLKLPPFPKTPDPAQRETLFRDTIATLSKMRLSPSGNRRLDELRAELPVQKSMQLQALESSPQRQAPK